MEQPSDAAPSIEGLSTSSDIIAIAVGNSRVQIGLMRGDECRDPSSVGVDEPERIADLVGTLREQSSDEPPVVISSVNLEGAARIEAAISAKGVSAIYRFGRDLTIPIEHTLTESGEASVGHDRLLCALGAFAQTSQACCVVDLGTAVTIDFIDGTGVFHGGAILPGVSMMLRSLHEHTTALPDLAYEKPDPGSLEPGKQTDAAMILGVQSAIRGAVRLLAERYAEYYGAYPKVVATGGDLGVVEGDEFVEVHTPDLQLRGIRAACMKLIDDED